MKRNITDIRLTLLCAVCANPEAYHMTFCPNCGDDNIVVVEDN